MNVHELLEKGLYYYGLGEMDRAIELWREVLRLDPDNETAREYIEIETGRKVEVGAEPEAEEQILEPDEEIVEEPEARPQLSEEFFKGQQYLHNEEWARAAGAFESAGQADPSQHLYWAHMDLSRARLMKDVVDRLGGRTAIPVLTVPLNRLVGQKNFTQEEGFLLSLITGDMSLEDVIALSPLPRFQSYNIVHRLLEDDLVRPGG